MAASIVQPDAIQNIDIINLVVRIDRFLAEMQECVSATRNASTSSDITRWEVIQSDIKRNFAIAESNPEMDLPKYHPHPTDMPTPPPINDKQNPDVMNLTRLLIALRKEMSFSDAKERASGFSDAQSKRVDAVLQRIDLVLADVKANPEVDSPNSPDEVPSV